VWQRRTVWSAWALVFGLACACSIVFLQGMLRDMRAGDPALRVDFSSRPMPAEARFRVWGAQEYTLLIASVNHDTRVLNRPLNAGFEIEVVRPDGRAILRETYSPGATGHRVPLNYGDVKLAALQLEGSPLRQWVLRVSVHEPDPAFKTTQTHVKLHRTQYEPGMGGLMIYAIMIPGGILMLGALALSISLATGGSRLPLLITTSVVALVLLLPAVI
jgi:hypothetical protein